MPRWEYQTVSLRGDAARSWLEALENLGLDGWELIERREDGAGAVVLLLKRELCSPALARNARIGALHVRDQAHDGAAPERAPTGNNRRRLFQGVVRDLLAALGDGRLNEGDRLPSERQLAELFHASRPTVRDALLALELMGVIEARAGSGTYVVATAPNVSTLHTVHLGAPPRQLMEARAQIEPAVVGLAAQRVDDADLERLERLVRACEIESRTASTDVPETFLRLSLQFHSDLAALCGNVILATFAQQLVDATAHPLWILLNGLYLRDAETRAEEIANHRAILDALVARHADDAVRAMSAHLGHLSDGVFGGVREKGGVTAQRWRRRSPV